MPSVNVEENIKKIISAIEQMSKEILRLEGSLRMFQEFKASGLETIELPHEPRPEKSDPVPEEDTTTTADEEEVVVQDEQ